MREVYVRAEPSLLGEPFAGQTVDEHWSALLAQVGAARARSPSGALEVDGRCLALGPEQLHQALVDGRAPQGEPVMDAFDLAVAERTVVARYVCALGRSGVRFFDPERVWIEPTVRVAPGARIWGGVVLRGATVIGAGAEVGAGAVLVDTVVSEGAVLKPYTVCEGAQIGPASAVGPMAHLRPGAVLHRDVKVGNFVEVKKSTLHEGVRASHLTYLGDAEVFEGANIGAGTITCNYDGFGKYKTEIGARAFVGSNSALVAPIRIGADAIVGAGSTVTRSVPDRALMVERGEERVLEGRATALSARNRRRAGKSDG